MKKGPGPVLALLALGVAIVIIADRFRRTTTDGRPAGLLAFAEAIAFAEGYGVPGAIPTLRNKPGELKQPSSGGGITTFATPAEGWEALYNQLDLIRTGRSAYYQPTMTIAQVANVWTATEQTAWLSNVLASLDRQGYEVGSQTRIGAVLS